MLFWRKINIYYKILKNKPNIIFPRFLLDSKLNQISKTNNLNVTSNVDFSIPNITLGSTLVISQ